MKRLMGLRMLCSIVLFLAIAGWGYGNDSLQQGFLNPPEAARAQTWWHWMGGMVSRVGITADLEAMKRAGLSGAWVFEIDAFQLTDAENPFVVPKPSQFPKIKVMSPEWRELLKFATREADRLGLKLGIHNCGGWSSSGGPWITPELSSQKVVWSDTPTTGPLHFQAVLPQPEVDWRWNYYKDIAVLAVPVIPAAVPLDQVIDLSGQMQADGTLTWDVPPGAWRILRFGATTTGVENVPSPPEIRGLECDKLSREAVAAHFNAFPAKLIEDAGELAGKTLDRVLIDSYERGGLSWTPKFAEEFERRRGYPFLPWMPALAGVPINSWEEYLKFLWDKDRTIYELWGENYYGYMGELIRARGLEYHSEPYGGLADIATNVGAADVPMAEYWVESDWGWPTVAPVVGAARSYGKPVIAAEAFTAQPAHDPWTQTPYTLKATGDYSYCLGLNSLIMHTYAHQPWLDVRPGMTMSWWGTHFSRTQTWWELSRPWFDYLARCQFMLQQGYAVADFCALDGAAQQLQGFTGDSCSEEVLLTRMSVKDGLIVLPHGAAYRLLVLPERTTMTPAIARKVRELVAAGATVIGPRPKTSPSRQDYPACDAEVAAIGAEVWAECGGGTVTQRTFGKGRIISGRSWLEVLREDGIAPDFELAHGADPAINATHRRVEGAEIYFVANRDQFAKEVQATFRVSGRAPELWNAESGRIERAVVYSEANGRTTLPLRLEPSGSVFVVFREPSAAEHFVSMREEATDGARERALNLPASERVTVSRAVLECSDVTSGVLDLTQVIADKVRAGIYVIRVDDTLTTGDPGPLHPKQLRVDFLINGMPYQKVVMQNARLEVPQGIHAAARPDFELRTNAEGKAEVTAWRAGKLTLVSSSQETVELNAPAVPQPLLLDGPWRVDFPAGQGAPETIELERLSSWSEHADSGVRYFSGTGTYRKTFTLPEEVIGARRVHRLDLGEVRDFAEVSLNGKALGILWKPPFVVDLTEAAREGENTLEVHVTNLWPNRLIGDHQQPEDCEWYPPWIFDLGANFYVGRHLKQLPNWLLEGQPRPASGRHTFTTYDFFHNDSPLLPSGLLGPVAVRAGELLDVKAEY